MSSQLTLPKYHINQTVYYNTAGKFNKFVISAIKKDSHEKPEFLNPNKDSFCSYNWEYHLFQVDKNNRLWYFGWKSESNLLNREEFISQYGKDPELAYTQSAEGTPQR